MSQAPETLAREYVEKRLTQIASYETTLPTASKKNMTFEDRVQAVYAKLTSHQFCRQRPDDVQSFLTIISENMKQGTPIPFILGHGPLKNPNNCPYPHADWAEFFAYAQLMKLAGAVKALYEPGIEVSLYMDDSRAAYANKAPAALMDAYRLSVQEMIDATPFKQVIKEVVALSTVCPERLHVEHMRQGEEIITNWLADPANLPAYETQVLHAVRNLPAARTLPREELLGEAREATRRYLLHYEAEKLCGIWNQPDKLYMRYSPHAGFYQTFTLRKGSVSQPWQGQGALVITEQGKADAFIVTESKARRGHVSQELAFDIPGVPYLGTLPVLIQTPAPAGALELCTA